MGQKATATVTDAKAKTAGAGDDIFIGNISESEHEPRNIASCLVSRIIHCCLSLCLWVGCSCEDFAAVLHGIMRPYIKREDAMCCLCLKA